MAHRKDAPYQAQDPQGVKELCQSLEAHKSKGKGRGGFSVKKATFELPNGYSVDSWRMQDWDYKKPNLPTYARGLFTYKNRKGKDEIAVRGYDKFFNHGEVRNTEWMNVEKNTRGPYELSVKENGCIIFISGLDDGALLVCSKHSTGDRGDADKSHAIAGERWVDKQLAAVGRTRADLAYRLREMNATAVAELCDDSFEEHVLAYNPDTAGLYLHGINLNLPEFVTYPHHKLDEFADEWGFKKTMYIIEEDITNVKEFLDGVAETGVYAGRETEGFVIRCQIKEGGGDSWHDWFFKYKFEEPYLMYRQWRECTKSMIAGKEPRYKKHKKVTEEYLRFARYAFSRDPQRAKAYNQNHGIIALRDEFLASRGQKGSDIIREEIMGGEEVESRGVTGNVVLVPAATIGCGKTTVAVALVKLFGWGHFQNDNITGKGRRSQRFAEAICNLMITKPVVIADRNNHQRRERDQILNDVSRSVPGAKFVCLHWVHDRSNIEEIRKAMQDRVLSRGDNHQTIQAGSKDPQEIIGIMDGFIGRFEPVDPQTAPDDGFDTIINLDPRASSRENLETIVSKMHEDYPKLFGEMPSAEDLDNAIEAALNEYKPDVKHELNFSKNQGKKNQMDRLNLRGSTPQANGSDSKAAPKPSKPPKLEYFAVQLPAARINSILETVFKDQDTEVKRFYLQLKNSRRVQPGFHVTLIHRASVSQHPQLWDELSTIYNTKTESAPTAGASNSASNGTATQDPELGTCKVQLERLVWDNRLMCFVVRLIPEGEQQWRTTNEFAHVTVGTSSPAVKPKESNDLLKKWMAEGSGENGIREYMIQGHVVLDGTVRGVLQRY